MMQHRMVRPEVARLLLVSAVHGANVDPPFMRDSMTALGVGFHWFPLRISTLVTRAISAPPQKHWQGAFAGPLLGMPRGCEPSLSAASELHAQQLDLSKTPGGAQHSPALQIPTDPSRGHTTEMANIKMWKRRDIIINDHRPDRPQRQAFAARPGRRSRPKTSRKTKSGGWVAVACVSQNPIFWGQDS
jgi:hypothetical protein